MAEVRAVEALREARVRCGEFARLGEVSRADRMAWAAEDRARRVLEVMVDADPMAVVSESALASFRDVLHPRDRRGRFAEKPGGPAASDSKPRSEKPAAKEKPARELRSALPRRLAYREDPDAVAGRPKPKAEPKAAAGVKADSPEAPTAGAKGDGEWSPDFVGVRRTSVGHHYEAVGPAGELVIKPSEAEAKKALDALMREHEALPATHPKRLVHQARSRVLSGQPTTRDQHGRVRADGTTVYSKDRKALHDSIIDAFFQMDAKGNPGKGESRIKPPEGRKPRLYMSGGGFASGKGSAVKEFPNGEQAILLDPDKIKAMLPEFSELLSAGDYAEANLRTYEEAFDVAQAIAHRAQREGVDVVLDGVGNTSVEEVTSRIKSYMDAGYDPPVMRYVGIPTETAIGRARKRMEGAIEEGKTESIRWIPEDLMADVHASVSRILPDLIEALPEGSDFALYWTDVEWGAPAIPIGSRKPGEKWSVERQDLWEEFMAKANDAPARKAGPGVK